MAEVVAFNQDFTDRITGDTFFTGDLLVALNEEPPVSVRMHPKKVRPELQINGDVAWCPNAVYLSERPVFTLDPLFHAGSYYPQEAGSMLLDHVIRQLSLPVAPKLLDLCGAPGGKSTLLLSFLNNEGLLVSNEVINQRARILRENCSKWGYSNSIVTNNDPSDFSRLENFFDAIVVDAPCSGEGMFRKDQNARTEWSVDNVKLCASRQKRILSDVWDALKPGGYLIYSTCTFNDSENEQNVQWIVNELGGDLIVPQMPESITEGRNGIGHYGIPGISMSEGFYIAVIRKSGDNFSGKQKRLQVKGISKCKDVSELEDFVNTSSIDVYNWNDYLLAFPKDLTEDFLKVYGEMRIVKLGTELGTIARKGFVPAHDLAMNFNLRKEKESIELELEEALRYLRGETFPVEGKTGLQMVTFNKEPLGWIKNLGTRFNNLYPKEWRIKMNIDEMIKN